MSKPKVILHIGTHKTGSSALQSFFRRNFEILSSKGFTWINDSYLWGKIGAAPEDEISSDYIEAIQKQIYETAESTQNTLILSSEAFSGDVYRAYNNARFSAETLKKILDQCSVQVVLYLRRQDIFYESWYIQKIQEGQTYSFNDFCQILDFRNINWEPIVRHFTEAFGASQVTVRLYDKSFLKAGNIINDFTDVVMGFPDLEGFHEPHWSNRGMNLEALRVMRHLNQIISDSQQRNQIRFFLQQRFPRNLFDGFQILNPEQREQILLHFQPFN